MGMYDAYCLQLDAVESQHAEAVEAILKRGANVEDVKPPDRFMGLIY